MPFTNHSRAHIWYLIPTVSVLFQLQNWVGRDPTTSASLPSGMQHATCNAEMGDAHMTTPEGWLQLVQSRHFCSSQCRRYAGPSGRLKMAGHHRSLAGVTSEATSKVDTTDTDRCLKCAMGRTTSLQGVESSGVLLLKQSESRPRGCGCYRRFSSVGITHIVWLLSCYIGRSSEACEWRFWRSTGALERSMRGKSFDERILLPRTCKFLS